MNSKELANDIDKAITILKAVAVQLNDDVHPCATCGFHARENFPEYVIRKQIVECEEKLKRLAGSLRSQ